MSSLEMISLFLFLIGLFMVLHGLYDLWRFGRPSTGTKLQLRGLPESPLDGANGPIKSTIQTLMKNGLNDESAPRLISRLEWWNQINRYLDNLTDTEKSINRVTAAINALVHYYRNYRSEVEEDVVRALFERALQDPELCHLYAKLFKMMTSRTQQHFRRLFQMIVDEFNRPLSEMDGQSKQRKLNNIKLMATVFKRQLSGVPDDWITDCSATLVQRLEAGLEQSTEQLVHFLTSLLISESGDHGCHLLPSQQRQLLICFGALQQQAILTRTLLTSETITETEMKSESDTEKGATPGPEAPEV